VTLHANIGQDQGAVRYNNLVTKGLNDTEFKSIENPSNVNPLRTDDVFFKTQCVSGLVEGTRIITKFGTSSIGTNITPVTQSGFYRTPTTTVSLEILSNNSNDTFLGTGGRTIEIIGLDANFNEIVQIVEMNGTIPVSIPIPLIRAYRLSLLTSGTYADQITGSHLGAITLREAGGGQTWALISNSPFPLAQSQIGVTSIPINKTAYMFSRNITVDSVKSADVFLFERQNINDVTIPFTGILKMIQKNIGITGKDSEVFQSPLGPFKGPSDLGFMGVFGTGTGDISVDFQLLLVDN
jgi:hypothetical protein